MTPEGTVWRPQPFQLRGRAGHTTAPPILTNCLQIELRVQARSAAPVGLGEGQRQLG